nr:hypothetical protein GCM10020063_031050 [Dactylosporangium thailandense]
MSGQKPGFPQRSALMHVVDREYGGNLVQGRYKLTRFHAFPIKVRRPPRGSIVGEQKCGACGEKLPLAVASVGRRMLVRAAAAGIAVAALAAFIATVVYFVNAPVRDESVPSSLEGPPGWLLFLGTIGAPLVLIVAWSFFVTYDGVRIKGRSRRQHVVSAKARHVNAARQAKRSTDG